MSDTPNHIAIFLKDHGKHKAGDLVLVPGALVAEMVADSTIAIDHDTVGDDYSKLVDYKG